MMNAEQKRAWLGVVTGIACVVGYVALIPFLGPMAATGAFGLYGLNGIAPLIGRKQRADERDRSIERRATLGGAMASYMAFIFGCMGTWFVAFAWHGQEQVSVHLVATITFVGGIVFYTVRSVVVLVLYGRHVEADNA